MRPSSWCRGRHRWRRDGVEVATVGPGRPDRRARPPRRRSQIGDRHHDHGHVAARPRPRARSTACSTRFRSLAHRIAVEPGPAAAGGGGLDSTSDAACSSTTRLDSPRRPKPARLRASFQIVMSATDTATEDGYRDRSGPGPEAPPAPPDRHRHRTGPGTRRVIGLGIFGSDHRTGTATARSNACGVRQHPRAGSRRSSIRCSR